MQKTIKVTTKTVYGVERVYVTSDHKQFIENLTGQKSLTQKNIDDLKSLGFVFEIDQPQTEVQL